MKTLRQIFESIVMINEKEKLSQFNIQEKFHCGVKYGPDYYEVYKNPTPSEIQDILKQSKDRGETEKEYTTRVRGLIDDNGDVYVWGVTLLHATALSKIGIQPQDSMVQFVGYLDTIPPQLEFEIMGSSYEGEIDDNIDILKDTPFLSNLERAFPNFTMSAYKSTNQDNIKLIGKRHKVVPKRPN